MINKKGMGSIGSALVIVLAINIMLWFGQMAVLSVNPDGVNFFNPEGSLLNSFNKGNYSLSDDPLAQLPTSESSVSVTTGNIFTDLFSTVKNWFIGSTGLGYLLNVLSAPMSFLNALLLPKQFAFALGGLWYGVTFFLIIAFIRGDTG